MVYALLHYSCLICIMLLLYYIVNHICICVYVAILDLHVCMCALQQGRMAAADCPKVNYKP